MGDHARYEASLTPVRSRSRTSVITRVVEDSSGASVPSEGAADAPVSCAMSAEDMS